MTPETAALIERSIADLQGLPAQFASEMQALPPSAVPTTEDARRKEALLTISVLLPKLAAARGGDLHRALQRRGCQGRSSD